MIKSGVKKSRLREVGAGRKKPGRYDIAITRALSSLAISSVPCTRTRSDGVVQMTGTTVFGDRSLFVREEKSEDIQMGTTSDASSVAYRMLLLGADLPFSVKTEPILRGANKGSFMIIVEPQPGPRDIFRFLDLPSEIRNMIYRYALVAPGRSVAPHWMSYKHSGLPLQLLRLNKQVYHEAIHIAYSENTFRFDDPSTAMKVFNQVRVEPYWSSLLQTYWPHELLHIEISDHWSITAGKHLVRHLKRMPRLETITFPSSFLDHQGASLKLFLACWFSNKGKPAISRSKMLKLVKIGAPKVTRFMSASFSALVQATDQVRCTNIIKEYYNEKA